MCHHTQLKYQAPLNHLLHVFRSSANGFPLWGLTDSSIEGCIW